MPIFPLGEAIGFPPVDLALREPNGLLAIGGDLAPERLLAAYRHGIFPWFNPDDPILWWSPDPRGVLFLDEFHMSRSLAKRLRQQRFRVTVDTDFSATMRACAAPRPYAHGTWITEAMIAAYSALHALGQAHSVECWNPQGQRVGGIYGVSLGRVFYGESMFSTETDASKVAIAHLVQLLRARGYVLMDCQMETEHLLSLGARSLRRFDFCQLLDRYTVLPPSQPWPVAGSRLTWGELS